MTEPARPEYALGHAETELNRLSMQDRFWHDASVDVLRRAGLRPGMRVLDIGCGGGDLSCLAAELVRPGGRVLGIDQSAAAVARANERAGHFGVSQATFAVADVTRAEIPGSFDAIIGRFVLLYLADPAAVLRRLVADLDRPGTFAFIEMDMAAARTVPPVPEIDRALEWIRQAFTRAGVPVSMGGQLWRVLRDAGLEAVDMVVSQKLDAPDSPAATCLLAETVRSMLPIMERFGVASAAEVGIDGLAAGLHRAQVDHDAVVFAPCLVGMVGRIA